MKFSQFSSYLHDLEKTSSRLKMTEILAELFKKLNQQETAQACYLMQGSLVAKYESLEFNLSVKMVNRAIAKLLGKIDQTKPGTKEAKDLFNNLDEATYLNKVKQKYKERGDVGLVIENLMSQAGSEKIGNELNIQQVHEKLSKIAKIEGKGSQDEKITLLVDLLQQVDPVSARYILRIIIGKLRLGFSTMTIIDALSWTKFGDKSMNKVIERAYQKRADIGSLAQEYLALSKGQVEQYLKNYEVKVFTPIVPALAQRLNSSQEIIEKMNHVIAETKFDGLRVQIHINKQEAKKYQVYTRNLDNITHMFPELEHVYDKLAVNNCILDGEAIGYDQDTGAFVDFQTTIQRRRKHNIKSKAQEVPISFVIFDCLLLDNESLIDLPLSERRKRLNKLFEDDQTLQKTNYIITKDAEELQNFHEKQLNLGFEGAVIKKWDSKYVSGRKGWRWVKIKEEEGTKGKLKDTLDCIVMGYYAGKGKRAEFGIGALLIGVRDKQEKILTITKLGSGLTDDQLKKIKKICEDNKVKQKPKLYEVPKDLKPDYWTDPELVVEVAADEITKSPLHSAKVALRFPRLIKIRADKDWPQATSLKELDNLS